MSTAEQFAYMPAATEHRRGYQVVARSSGLTDDILTQMDAYMLPAGAGRNFTHSKSLLLLRDNLVAYSNIINIGDGYDGRPDALYNHTLVLSRASFASVGFDTRVLDKYFIKEPPHGTLSSISVESGAPEPRLGQKLQHLAFPVLRAIFLEQNVAISGVDDPSFLPNVLAMLPPSMRMLPFCTYLPKPAQQPAYRLATYDEHIHSLPTSFVHLGSSSVGYASGNDLDDAIMFLIARVASGNKSANEVFLEFDKMASNSPRDKLVLLSKIFGISSNQTRLQAHQADVVMRMLRKFDAKTQSRLLRRIEPFVDRKSRDIVLSYMKLDKKITVKSIESLLDGVAAHKKRRVLQAAYGARGQDFEKNADRLLNSILDSPHAPAVCGFFVSTKGLHPSLLRFLSGKTRASPKRRRFLLDLVLPAAIKDNPKLVPEILACNIHDRQSKSDARNLLDILAAMTESEQVGSDLVASALASVLGKAGSGSALSQKTTKPRAPSVRMHGAGIVRRQPARRFRDPIHGFIDVYDNEMSIIQDPVFQRLRRIKQLSFAHLVYHGAEHSRFGHVLGTMHLADRALRSIKANSEKSGSEIDDEDVRTARMAALLHDVGHRPFSHALDSLFEESHEDISKALVLGRFAPMIEGTGSDRVDPKQVANLIQRRLDDQKPFLTELISGQLDVDKMDYLLRDSYYAGVKYGMFDLDMLMDSLVLAGNDLAVLSKGIMAAEQMIIARYHMFGQVYHHKTKRSFESLAQRVASRLLQDGYLEYPSAKSLSNDADDLATMDDAWLMKAFKSVKDKDVKNISKDLLARKPFEEVLNSDNLDLKNGSSESAIGYFTAVKQSVHADLKSIGIEPLDVIFDKSSVLPYRLFPYSSDLYEDRDTTRVLIRYQKSEHGVPIEQRSKVVKAIASDFIVHRMFVHKSKANDIRAYLESKYPDTRDSQRL